MNNEYASFYADILFMAMVEEIRGSNNTLSPDDYNKARDYSIIALETMRREIYSQRHVTIDTEFLLGMIKRLKE